LIILTDKGAQQFDIKLGIIHVSTLGCRQIGKSEVKK
jgi:hypothetical protein